VLDLFFLQKKILWLNQKIDTQSKPQADRIHEPNQKMILTDSLSST
jgi:hypothetical protein